MGRTPKEINWKTVRQKIEAGCPAKEIFSEKDCEVCADTFYKRFKEEFGCNFSDYSDQVSQTGLGDLRLMAHAKAMQGNITMLQFLCRVRLGMKEPETTTLGAPNQVGIDQSHIIMQLQNRVNELEENANKSKTE